MNYIAETGAAALVCGYLVALFKMAFPNAKTATLVIVAIFSGVLATVLVSVANGSTYDLKDVAQWIIQGVIAAAGAAGLTRTDGRAQEVRESAQGPNT